MKIFTGTKRKGFVWLAAWFALFFACAERAHATDLHGTYTTTQVIVDDSRLTDDVTCAPALIKMPCIVFGASHIKLSLNGFTITGPVDPLDPTQFPLCSKPPDLTFGVGIESIGQTDIQIEGPGVVQHFERWGILLRTTSGAVVRNVTGTRNCWSGMQLTLVTDSRFIQTVWANNAAGSNGAGCGGICFTNSNNNVIRKSTFSGNGTVVSPSTTASGNVDFGVGLEGTSSGDLIEESDMGGNANGVLVFPAASGNTIRRNILVGNPAGEVRVEHPERDGADIHDLATAGANTYEDNFCLTYSGPGTAPCPNVRAEGVEEAANQLKGAVKNHAQASHGRTTDGADLFSAVVLVLATVFRRMVLG